MGQEALSFACTALFFYYSLSSSDLRNWRPGEVGGFARVTSSKMAGRESNPDLVGALYSLSYATALQIYVNIKCEKEATE